MAGWLRRALPSSGGLILVDGRSGSGKTTLARRLADTLGASIVHTDDLAWHHDPMEWSSLLLDGVLAPWRSGDAVSLRPPAWERLGRPGQVSVPAGRPQLVVEGVGAGRAAHAPSADLVIWVQTDRSLARARGIARDIELGRDAVAAETFWDEWMSSEEPFLAADRPWERADLVVDGTPSTQPDGIPEGWLRVALGPAITPPAGSRPARGV